MQFSPPRPNSPPRENIVPMINVVFLLLIFFLMTAQIAPPEPFEVTPPRSASETSADGPATLYVGPDGTLGFLEARGEGAVFAALAQMPKGAPLLLRADAGLKANKLAELLARLAAAGISDVALVTARRTN
ncbi:ExbD/TolR family protein [Profundibacter sp.]